MKTKITGEMCVQVLKEALDASKTLNALPRLTAKEIASVLSISTQTDSRAVATALRKPVDDGRVKIRYDRGLGLGASYKFVRSTPAKAKGGAA